MGSGDKIELFDESGASRGYYSPKNRVNDLTGKEWVFWTRSVISKVYPSNLQHRLRGQHGGQKPPELCADLIRIFTKAGGSVLDPFMGVGGVLLGAALSGRRAVGIDVNQKWIDIYREVCRREGLAEMEAIAGDAEQVLPGLDDRRFDCIVTDVPYCNMDRAPRSKGRFKKVGEQSRDARETKLSAFHAGEYRDTDEWLDKMYSIFRLACLLLKKNGYLVSFIGDMYYDGEYRCLSADLANRLRGIPGLTWKANLIWYDVSKKLHLYGYQYAYIPSMIHQNILVFRQEPEE